jgi:small subunit ribosomal protein S17
MATERPTSGKDKSATHAAAPKRAPKAAPAPKVVFVDERNPLQKRQTIVGTVVSNKMQKTIVVKVDRRVRHGLYGKFVVKSRRFKAHDEKNDAKMGDRVVLVESRPLSREKRWSLQEILRKAGQTVDANV